MQFDLAIEITLGLGEGCTRLGGPESQLPIIENGEELTRFHVVAFLDQDAADFAAHLGDDLGVGLGFQRGGPAVHREHLATNGPGDFDRDGGVGGCLGVLFQAAALAAGERRHWRRPRPSSAMRDDGDA